MDNGRRVSSPELEEIAKGFGVTTDRVKREDTHELEQELHNLVKNRSHLTKAVEIAERLLRVAIGYTERFEILNNLGIALYILDRHEEAEQIWLNALPIAKKIESLFDEKEPLYKVTCNLLLTYEILKNYKTLVQLLGELEPTIDEFPPKLSGTVHYSLGKIAKSIGNLAEYRKRLHDSLKCFKLTGETRAIGRAEYTVGYAEYVSGNYLAAKEYFGKAANTLRNNVDLRFTAEKDYVKALLKLGEKELAIEHIESTLEELRLRHLPMMLGKFLLLHALASECSDSAKQVLRMKEVENELHFLACQFLMEQSSKNGDATELMKYYKIAEKFKKSAIADLEGI